jgi:acyl-CoA thioester hydrolase
VSTKVTRLREELLLARIDRAALEQAHFPVTITLPTRFADLDFQGHVNNAAVPVILQESRVDFNKAINIDALLGGLRPMIAGLTIEYAAELNHPGEIEILTGVSKIGRTSFTLQQIARQKGRTAIYAETTLVIADATGAAALPEGLRRNLETLLLRQSKEGNNSDA